MQTAAASTTSKASESPEQSETRRKVRSLFEFVKALNQRRNPVPRQLDATPWKLELDALPFHAAVTRQTVSETAAHAGDSATILAAANVSDSEVETATADAGAAYTEEPIAPTAILRIQRPTLTTPPNPPETLTPWLTAEWQTASTKDPRYLDEIPTQQTDDKTNQPITVIEAFAEDETRVRIGEQYYQAWDVWAVQERLALEAEKLFQHVYALRGMLQREAEKYEIVLADGILFWDRPDGAIRYPLLARRVSLEFDAEIAEFRFIDDAESTEFAAALFREMTELDASLIASFIRDFDALKPHPLDIVATNGFLRGLAATLDARGTLIEAAPPAKAEAYPIIYRRPLLFLRPRSQGIAAALDGILSHLDGEVALPPSLLRIVGAHDQANEMTAESATDEHAWETLTDANEDGAILFTKPGNAEQLEIARKLARDDSLIVQGPPGTGKTHTIANLLGHLLAQGNKVLVTSHTTKALSVLRDKVAEPLKPLCVSVLNESSRDTAELQNSVASIAERLGNSNADQLEREADAFTYERIALLERIRLLRRELLDARLMEQTEIVIAGKGIRPIDAGKFVRDGGESQSWIPGNLTPADFLPLDQAEITSLYASNTSI